MYILCCKKSTEQTFCPVCLVTHDFKGVTWHSLIPTFIFPVNILISQWKSRVCAFQSEENKNLSTCTHSKQIYTIARSQQPVTSPSGLLKPPTHPIFLSACHVCRKKRCRASQTKKPSSLCLLKNFNLDFKRIHFFSWFGQMLLMPRVPEKMLKQTRKNALLMMMMIMITHSVQGWPACHMPSSKKRVSCERIKLSKSQSLSIFLCEDEKVYYEEIKKYYVNVKKRRRVMELSKMFY